MSTLRGGSLDLAVVSDGLLRLDPSAMFGPAQPPEFRDAVHLEDGRVPLSVNCLLVRAGERRILIDTGSGRDEPLLMERYGGGSGYLVDNLRSLGITPDDMDAVIVTHAHADHVGGAAVQSMPTFPKARYWLWQKEWDHWTTPEAMAERPFLKRKLPPLKEHGLLELVDAEMEIAPGVRLISAPGHTPGHMCVALTSGQEMAIYTGDLLHHDSQLEHPECSAAVDLLPAMSATSRQRILAEALQHNAILLTAHLPTPGIARPSAGRYT